MHQRHALVTGAAGFIGSEVVRQLLTEGIRVTGIDNLNDYYDPRLKEHRLGKLSAHKGFTFLKLDIENMKSLTELFSRNQFDVVYHLAARAGVGPSLREPEVYYTTNVMGTLNLLELMKNKGPRKIVLASTSSLYAGEELPFSESAPVNRPISPYAASKKAAEVMAYTYHYHFGIDCSVVRYFTVYGPAGRPDMSIFRFVRWIDEGAPIILLGSGQQSRDFTYVEDIARGTILAGRSLGFEVINLGGGRAPTTLMEVIGKAERLLGKKAIIEHHDPIKADILETQADVRKAKSLLGWTAEVGIDEGLRQSILWYQSNLDFARSIPLP